MKSTPDQLSRVDRFFLPGQPTSPDIGALAYAAFAASVFSVSIPSIPNAV